MKKLIKDIKIEHTQELALKKLETLGLPNSKIEEYRYFKIKDLLQKEWDIHTKQNTNLMEGKDIVIVDGALQGFPKDMGIDVSFSNEFDIDLEHFDPIYYLGHTLCSGNLQIRFKKDCDVKIRQVFTKSDKMIPYRISLFIENGVKVRLLDLLEDMDSSNLFACSGYDVFVDKEADFTLITEKTTFKNDSTYIFSHSVKVEENAVANIHSFDLGEGKSLQLYKATLQKNSHINSYHLLFSKSDSNIGTVSKIIHEGENAKSIQKSKNILQDKTKAIFDALIKIENSAKGSITHQNSQAILLNDGALMASKPQLEIYIDDVEASHGSTIGELDKDQLFYLRSRGISEAEAKKLLILAFANEMIDVIEDDDIKEFLHSSFDRSYYDKANIECISTCHNCENTVFKKA